MRLVDVRSFCDDNQLCIRVEWATDDSEARILLPQKSFTVEAASCCKP